MPVSTFLQDTNPELGQGARSIPILQPQPLLADQEQYKNDRKASGIRQQPALRVDARAGNEHGPGQYQGHRGAAEVR